MGRGFAALKEFKHAKVTAVQGMKKGASGLGNGLVGSAIRKTRCPLTAGGD